MSAGETKVVPSLWIMEVQENKQTVDGELKVSLSEEPQCVVHSR